MNKKGRWRFWKKTSSRQQQNWVWIIPLTQNILCFWSRTTCGGPKWTLLTSLHKALTWITLKICGVNCRPKFMPEDPQIWRSSRDWRRMHLNCPGCVKDFIRKYNCYKCSLLSGKRVHNWWLGSGRLIYSEPGSFWLLCNFFVSVCKIK